MTEPTVCAILLTADRPALARRAVECFRVQTYPAKRMWILDTSKSHCVGPRGGSERDLIFHDTAIPMWPITIGQLRNNAAKNSVAEWNPDILVHWDDDDYSHPNRIAEQVALLQSSGADVVGYNETLFWNGQRGQIEVDPSRCGPDGLGVLGTVKSIGEAWLYSNQNRRYALGTSLCYWRKTWERKPFAATSRGEDLTFCTGLNVRGLSSLTEMGSIAGCDPRMIARIHAGNTSTAYDPRKMAEEAAKPGGMWRRAPEWDTYCRRTMEC